MFAVCSGAEVAAGGAAVGLTGGVPAFLRCGAKRKEEEEAEEDERGKKRIHGFFLGDDDEVQQQQPSESSSIGVPSSSSSEEHKGGGEDEEGEEVQSKERSEGGLGSFDSVEESLPIKRGLSSHFAGKSKSFASLSDAAAAAAAGAKGLAKPENPINKRRRLLLSSSRRASCSSLAMISLPPVLISPEHAVEEEP